MRLPLRQLRLLVQHMLLEDELDVDVPARLLGHLSPEEMEAFRDQVQARAEKSQHRRAEKEKHPKYKGVQVPARILQHLEPEELDAYVSQISQHGEFKAQPPKPDDEEMVGDTLPHGSTWNAKVTRPPAKGSRIPNLKRFVSGFMKKRAV